MVAISEVVDVSIRVESSSIASASFDSILLAGSGGTGTNDANFNAGWANHEVRRYTSYSALSSDTDIKPNANVIKMAQVAFAQVPAVSEIYVGRIDEGTPAAQVSTLTFQTVPLISGQDVEVFINGASIGSVSWATDNDTTMDAVAALIALESEVATAVASASGGGDKDLITITGAVAGESFLVTAEVQTGATVDEAISQVITTAAIDKISAADINALYASNGSWFGYCHDFSSNADAATAAAALAALKKYGMFRHESSASIPELNTNFSGLIYSSSADSVGKWVQVAWLSAMLGRPIGSYNPAYLSLELVDTEDALTGTQESLLKAGNSNWYSTIAGRDLTYSGLAGNGGWVDTYINVLWLEARMEERVFAALTAADKIPFSDAGIQIIVSEVSAQLSQAEDLGVILSSPAYVVDYPLAADISATDKSARLLTGITFEAYTGSGINTIKISGTLVD